VNTITIIGAGFAGLTAARRLRKKHPTARITLISPRAELLYYPSLIWIPTGLRQAHDLIFPLDRFFGKYRIKHIAATVTGLRNNGRIVMTDRGPYPNDWLLIASGGRFLKKLPGIEHALTLCEGVTAATRMRMALETMKSGTIAMGFGGNPKEPTAMRGGPMFELLFGIDTWLREQGKRNNFRLVFFSPAPRPGQRLGEQAVEGLLETMFERNIETHLGHKLIRFEADRIVTEGGTIETDAIFFMPGMTGPAWATDSGLPLSEGGLIQANEYCQVPGMPQVYVAGDSGSYPGPDWLPKQAHMADLQDADLHARTDLHRRHPRRRYPRTPQPEADVRLAGALDARD